MRLQPLTESDRELIRQWRNAPEVRRHMFNCHEISAEEHHVWFQSIQNDPGARWFLCRDNAGRPVGVVNFTRLDVTQQTALWGFYTRPGVEPGTGTRMLLSALDYAFDELELYKVCGEVLDDNVVSLRLHDKLGFTREGVFRDQHFDGERRVDVIRFGLLVSEWPEHRERLYQRYGQSNDKH